MGHVFSAVGVILIVELVGLFRSKPVGPNQTIGAIEAEASRRAREELDKAKNARVEAVKAVEQVEQRVKETELRVKEAETAREEAMGMERAAVGRESEARTARVEAERKRKEGIQPEVWPTTHELNAAKTRHQYTEGVLHFAIAGIAGSGKSSLINSFRGLRNNDAGAAPTGITETTGVIARYADPDPQRPFAWYDIPGAGTLKMPDWEYFNKQGLYIFDCIIVVLDNRFTATDIAILKNCARFNIPSYIVRSKSNQHIRNMMDDMGHTSDDGDDRRAESFTSARDKFVTETYQSVRVNLERANLPQQRAYIVAKDTLLSVVKGKAQGSMIDEVELLRDLLSDARARRPADKSLQQKNIATVAEI